MSRLFTSESVTEGHPDKIADQISDSILDALITEDPHSRVACETFVTTGLIVIGGEVTTEAYADIAGIARERVLEIGYDSSDKGFDGASCGVLVSLDAQSPDIAQGVDYAEEARVGGASDPLDLQGAGDQGLMFGFACDETPELMPLPITISHRLAEQLTRVRKDGTLPYLRPDGKTQVTIEYDDNDRPVRVEAIVISTQHEDGVDLEKTLPEDLKKHVIDVVLADYDIDASDPKIHINPTGKFVIGGPLGDAGLTGRKIIVDTYGGYARHGGGAFSGKDPSKVDRSAAYAMRWVAKNIVDSAWKSFRLLAAIPLVELRLGAAQTERNNHGLARQRYLGDVGRLGRRPWRTGTDCRRTDLPDARNLRVRGSRLCWFRRGPRMAIGYLRHLSCILAVPSSSSHHRKVA